MARERTVLEGNYWKGIKIKGGCLRKFSLTTKAVRWRQMSAVCLYYCINKRWCGPGTRRTNALLNNMTYTMEVTHTIPIKYIFKLRTKYFTEQTSNEHTKCWSFCIFVPTRRYFSCFLFRVSADIDGLVLAT